MRLNIEYNIEDNKGQSLIFSVIFGHFPSGICVSEMFTSKTQVRRWLNYIGESCSSDSDRQVRES